jgi:hypothetical protein
MDRFPLESSLTEGDTRPLVPKPIFSHLEGARRDVPSLGRTALPDNDIPQHRGNVRMMQPRVIPVTLLLVFLVTPLLAQTTEPAPDSNLSVDWKSLFWQSSFSIGVMNGFRIAREQQTRGDLKGPFFGDWFGSIGNMHGWNDGDELHVNYLGHPMQGAFTGFMFVQNDRKYRSVEYGWHDPNYWKSRLRAMGFAWAFSEQFEIGPASEASLGNIQSYYPAYGFVDHVVTPVFGLGWMVAEDVADKYLVKWAESRTTNPWVRALVRSWANPSRSFANFMAFRRPWERYTRLGVTEYDPKAWKAAQAQKQKAATNGGVASSTFLAKPGQNKDGTGPFDLPFKIPAFELTAHYDFFHNSPTDSRSGSCNGGGATGAFALNRWVSAVIDVSGCQMSFSDPNLSGQSLTYLFGPRFTYRKGDRWSFYLNVLLGGQKLNQQQIFPERIPTGDLTEWNKLTTWEQYAQISEVSEANGFAASVGGGVDLTVNRAFAIRLGNIDHLWSTIGDFNDVSYAHGFRISSGAVLRLGTW